VNIPKESTTLVGATAITVFYLVTSWLVSGDYSTYTRLLTETGVYETVGAFSCLIAALLFFYAYIKLPQVSPLFSKLTRRSPFVLALALGSLFLFLEEMSYGQHILGLKTPAWLTGINQQNEINLHNISGIHENAHLIGLVLLKLYYLVLPVLIHLSLLARRFIHFIGLPVADLQISFFMLISGILYRNIYLGSVVRAGVQNSGVNYAEVEEVVIEVILMIFAIKYFISMRENKF
jgi:hypothetical protein